MSATAIFKKLREALDEARVPYFVTGSFVNSAHGVPRSTNDIDIVIAPTREQLSALLKEFPEAEYYSRVVSATARIIGIGPMAST
ncbi:MAG: hypothetical protein QOI24_4037 [Acidobacteriota bacterium]|jgi:hypothetical protein|nr:hypothetical protein [Acidobacteriota bacterium]